MFLRSHNEIKNDTLLLLVEIVEILNKNADQQELSANGYIDLLVQLLKIKRLKSSFAAEIIDIFTEFHDKKILQSSAYIKIFEGLIYRLEI